MKKKIRNKKNENIFFALTEEMISIKYIKILIKL